ncbi:MAG: extracellular solute-binding protein [Candidatus Parcubacteria bacterium]|nr:extracellular solute-binding protein [Candidatus Parcubacteria bacterium]
MSKFQIIIIAVCVIAVLVAVLIFAGVLPGFKKGAGGKAAEISMWGTFPEGKIRTLISDFNETNRDFFKINYSEKKSPDYENEIINNLASASGPDIWVLTQDLVLKDKDKVYPIPFTSYQERNYRDNFIDSADLFIDGQNIIGLPLAVDPIVLYWNRDLFSSNGVSQPPQYWDEFLVDVQNLVKRDDAGNITQAGAALGEFQNVKNAKEILSMLILQADNPIVENGTLNVVLGEKGKNLLDPTESAVRFFNEFSNPGKTSYSWNKALPDSDKMFIAGSLAMYFGYASELENIKAKNPHLNFDIAGVPQIKDSKIKATFGRIYSLVISKNSKQVQAAYSALLKLTDNDFSKNFSKAVGLGSARRDVLAGGADDPFLSTVYKSAIMSRAWLEPDPAQVSGIFKNMVESSATGQLKISEAVRDAKNKLEELIK